MRVVVAIDGLPDRVLIADDPDEMFLAIAALDQEVPSCSKITCTVVGMDYRGPETDKYKSLFTMGRP